MKDVFEKIENELETHFKPLGFEFKEKFKNDKYQKIYYLDDKCKLLSRISSYYKRDFKSPNESDKKIIRLIYNYKLLKDAENEMNII